MYNGNEQKAIHGDYPDWSSASANRARDEDRGLGAQDDVCLAPGTVLQEGRYAILAVIPESRESELSIVYLAEHTALRRKVAIKEYFPRRVAHRSRSGAIAATHQSTAGKRTFDDGLAAFEREAQHLAEIKHPNIVRVEDVFRERGTVYLAMEYIDGSNLSACLDEGSRAGTSALLAWLAPLLDAVSALHDARPPIYHRDIKPQNIRIRSSDRQPVLLDFGAARGVAGSTTMTMIHTPSYAPPEQTSNLQDSTAVLRPTLDIYAIGATVYHWLTGAPPPDVMQRSQFLTNNMADPLVPLTARITDRRVDGQLLMVIDRCLAMRPNERPQSVADIRVVIDAIRTGTQGAGGKRGDNGERRRWPIAAAGMLAGIGVSAGAVYWWAPLSALIEPAWQTVTGQEAPGEAHPHPNPQPQPAPPAPAPAPAPPSPSPPEPTPDPAPVDPRLAKLQAFLDGKPLRLAANPGIFSKLEGTLTLHDGTLRIEDLEFGFEPEWPHDSGVRGEILLARQFRIYLQQAVMFEMDAPHAQSGDWTLDSVDELETRTFTPGAALEIPYKCASVEDLSAGKCPIRIVVGIGDSESLLTAETLDPAGSIK